jgi:hypothetical protein
MLTALVKLRRAIHSAQRPFIRRGGHSFGAETIHSVRRLFIRRGDYSFGAETIHSARPLQFLTAAFDEPL